MSAAGALFFYYEPVLDATIMEKVRTFKICTIRRFFAKLFHANAAIDYRLWVRASWNIFWNIVSEALFDELSWRFWVLHVNRLAINCEGKIILNSLSSLLLLRLCYLSIHVSHLLSKHPVRAEYLLHRVSDAIYHDIHIWYHVSELVSGENLLTITLYSDVAWLYMRPVVISH